MATLRRSDLTIYPELSSVTITGFQPEKDEATDPDTGATFDAMEIDPPGCANYFVMLYGMAPDDSDEADPGILWTDYDGPGWTFDVLVASDEVEAIRRQAEESGYSVDKVEPISEPSVFGDGSGTVTILKHPEGWVLAS